MSLPDFLVLEKSDNPYMQECATSCILGLTQEWRTLIVFSPPESQHSICKEGKYPGAALPNDCKHFQLN